jgi:hypothetical protein
MDFVIGTEIQDSNSRTNETSKSTVAGVAGRVRSTILHISTQLRELCGTQKWQKNKGTYRRSTMRLAYVLMGIVMLIELMMTCGSDDAVNVSGAMMIFESKRRGCKRVLCDKRALAHKSRGFVTTTSRLLRNVGTIDDDSVVVSSFVWILLRLSRSRVSLALEGGSLVSRRRKQGIPHHPITSRLHKHNFKCN